MQCNVGPEGGFGTQFRGKGRSYGVSDGTTQKNDGGFL